MGDYETNLVAKLDNNEKLTERELQSMVYEYEVDRNEGENRRWSRTNGSVCKLGGRYFSVEWEEGLTECQENEFYCQPYEVRKEEYDKVVRVVEWKRVNAK